MEIDVEAPAAVAPAPRSPAPPLIGNGAEIEQPEADDDYLQRRGVRPYGGGHATDWSWGCGGSPYRSNGRCDNWKVGCAWQVTVDGIAMTREHTNLGLLADAIEADDVNALPLLNPAFEQFDHGPGGRITFLSQVPRYVGYQVQFAYEGVEEWNSSIVYEKQPFPPGMLPGPGLPIPDPLDFATEQRSMHYKSSLHSGELNVVQYCDPAWRPYCGIRYIKFDDEINDFINQEAPPPLPGPGPTADPDVGDVIGPVLTTDRLNLFDIENNLIGFQVGLLHDSWRASRRFAFEGFLNTGVYYNKIKYTNLMGTFTTQEIADDTDTIDFDESRIDFSDVTNNDVRELSEIAFSAEASLSGVCRLNKCWALRAGYQVLFLHNVHLADDAFLTGDTEGRSLVFHGWHAGVECRR